MDKWKKAITLAEKERIQILSNKNFNEYKCIEPNEDQKLQLKQLIFNMDTSDQNLLFFVYCYNHSFNEAESILNIENAKGRILYISSYLAELIGYEDALISEKALKTLTVETMEEIDEPIINENKSSHFHNSHNKIKYAIAVCAAIFILLFSANAYADGKIFQFIIKTYKEFSLFFVEDTNCKYEDYIKNNKLSFEINYIPERFNLESSEELLDVQIQKYRAENGDKLALKINTTNQKSYLNTEDNANISGRLYLEKYTNSGWKIITSWKVSGKGSLSMSKSYRVYDGEYRARVNASIGSDYVNVSSTSCTFN